MEPLLEENTSTYDTFWLSKRVPDTAEKVGLLLPLVLSEH